MPHTTNSEREDLSPPLLSPIRLSIHFFSEIPFAVIPFCTIAAVHCKINAPLASVSLCSQCVFIIPWACKRYKLLQARTHTSFIARGTACPQLLHEMKVAPERRLKVHIVPIIDSNRFTCLSDAMEPQRRQVQELSGLDTHIWNGICMLE